MTRFDRTNDEMRALIRRAAELIKYRIPGPIAMDTARDLEHLADEIDVLTREQAGEIISPAEDAALRALGIMPVDEQAGGDADDVGRGWKREPVRTHKVQAGGEAAPYCPTCRVSDPGFLQSGDCKACGTPVARMLRVFPWKAPPPASAPCGHVEIIQAVMAFLSDGEFGALEDHAEALFKQCNAALASPCGEWGEPVLELLGPEPGGLAIEDGMRVLVYRRKAVR